MTRKCRQFAPILLAVVLCSAASKRGDEFLVGDSVAGKIAIGMKPEEVITRYGKTAATLTDLQLEGMPAPAIEIRLAGDTRPALVAELDKGFVYRISVNDKRFRTSEGIGVGSTLEQVRNAYEISWYDFGEGDFFAFAGEVGLSFGLDRSPPDEWRKFKRDDLVSGESIVRSILVTGHRKPQEQIQAVLCVVVDTVPVGGCDKYCWYELQIKDLLSPNQSLKAGQKITVAAYSWSSKPPAGDVVVGIVHFPNDQDKWKLVQKSNKPTWTSLEDDCRLKGGAIQGTCLRGAVNCVVPFADGGKPCSNSSECQGGCFLDRTAWPQFPPKGTAATGVCRRDNSPCGCFARVEGGKAEQGICAD